ncbi:MAG: 3'-5' exoribonuclease [Flavobacteriales bacterium]|nr:3'-5' exoribonuclease [Flavobacteriales bacterium]
MKLFLDTEFTSLTQNSQLISLALVGESGDSFYAEFDDYDEAHLSDWHKQNVIAHLSFLDRSKFIDKDNNVVYMKGNSAEVKSQLEVFLDRNEQIEMWGDNHAYDWVLFCELWGGALILPKMKSDTEKTQIHYVVRDICTLFELKEKDTNEPRRNFAGMEDSKEFKPHHALWDAKASMLCYKRLIQL